MKYFVMLLAVAVGPARGSPEVITLENLAARYPEDRLPPIRANRPDALKLAAQAKSHPYLLFNAESRETLRAGLGQRPYKELASRIFARADALALEEAPLLKPEENRGRALSSTGEWNDEFLRRLNESSYYRHSYLIKEALPVLGFAYQLTGEKRYAEAGRRWLFSLAAQPSLVRPNQTPDILEANIAFGLALGYDWLHEVLSPQERERIRAAMVRLGAPMHAGSVALLSRKDADAQRATLGNNHRTRTYGMFGLLALSLLAEEPAAVAWTDTAVQLNRDRLLPSVLAPNGEYVDAWDHFDSSIQDPLPFFIALKQIGGEDLFADPRMAGRFRGISTYFLFGLEAFVEELASGPSRLASANGYYWLALARFARDPVAQWIGTRDAGLNSVNNPVLGYIFYDPSIAPEAPKNPRSLYFPYSGMVKMGDWTESLVAFRCGPEIGKETGDQNGFRVFGSGRWILPGSRWKGAHSKGGPTLRADDPAKLKWELYGWFWGSPAQNVVLTQPELIGDAVGFDLTGQVKIAGGVQFCLYRQTPGRVARRGQWLGAPDVPKNGDLSVVHLAGEVDYVLGEAQRAYEKFGPALWQRHVLVVKDNASQRTLYAVVCDELDLDKNLEAAWQVRSAEPIVQDGGRFHTEREGLAGWVFASAPTHGVLKYTPAPLVKEREQFLQWRLGAGEPSRQFISVLGFGSNGEALEAKPIPAEGGWAVRVTTNGVNDTILFRSAHSQEARADGLSTTSNATIHRNGHDFSRLYILGAPSTHSTP